jgi:hypothetical protein
LVDANVSEKHTVTIVGAEMAMLGGGQIYIGLEEGKAEGVGQSQTRNEGQKVLGQYGFSKQASEGEGLGREEVSPLPQPPLPSIAMSALKTETVCFSETSASADKSTWCQNPDEHHHLHCRENLESHKICRCVVFFPHSQFHVSITVVRFFLADKDR